MVGHGDGSANIEPSDALIPLQDFSLGRLQISKNSDLYPKPVNERFDVIISNPPFSVTVDRDTAKTFPQNFLQGEIIWDRIKDNNETEVATELLFIERYYQLLRSGGRLGVVLPESVFDTNVTRPIRCFLFKYFNVLGIISLPVDAFAPYTTTKTNILFAEKKNPMEVEKWNNLWDQHKQEYLQIINQVKKYLRTPSLKKKVLEILARFEEESGELMEDELKVGIANEVLNIVNINNNQADIYDEIISYIVGIFKESSQDCQEILKNIIDRKRSFLPSITEYKEIITSKDEFVDLLSRLLMKYFDPTHKNLSIKELIEEYSEEIGYADEEWWVFNQVSRQIDSYHIVLAHADEIGYKRGVRGEEERINELFAIDSTSSKIIINLQNPQSILEYFLANINWSKPERV